MKPLVNRELSYILACSGRSRGERERDESVPTVATVKKLEKALQLPPLTLMRIKEVDRADDGIKKKVGKTMREFEKELVRNMTESELESMCKTISTLTGLIKK